MNILKGAIKEIEVSGELSIVRVDVRGNLLSTIVIDTPETAEFLKLGNPVRVIFKETEVIIGVGDMKGISLRNKFWGKIKIIEKDLLLSKLLVDCEVGEISSIITSNAVEQLKLQEGMEVCAMIKTNELMLSE